jgi:hypothetical protein
MANETDVDLIPCLCIVARCCACWSVGSAHVITPDCNCSEDIGEIAQKSLDGFAVTVERGPVTISGCNCTRANRRRLSVLLNPLTVPVP